MRRAVIVCFALVSLAFGGSALAQGQAPNIPGPPAAPPLNAPRANPVNPLPQGAQVPGPAQPPNDSAAPIAPGVQRPGSALRTPMRLQQGGSPLRPGTVPNRALNP